MTQDRSGSPTSGESRTREPAWDAALVSAQRRAAAGRARLDQHRRATARQQRLVAAWLRQLSSQ